MAKNTSRRGASRGGSKKQSRQVPGWVWLFTGVIGGLFVAFLVHLAQVQMEQGRTGGGDRTAVEKPQPEEKDSDGAAKDDAGLELVPTRGAGDDAPPESPSPDKKRDHFQLEIVDGYDAVPLGTTQNL